MSVDATDCAKCGATRSTDGSKCKKCACKLVCYCSKECQRGDWADHKASCTYKKARAIAPQVHAEEAFPGIPQDVVVTHILTSVTDPIVLARLRAVSRAMRDAVERTGILVEEMTTGVAVELGCLETLQHKLQKARLDKSEVCTFAAKGGQLEVIRWARAHGCPWDEWTSAQAAWGGQLEVLQWAHATGCPWDEFTCSNAAESGHLEVLHWARANGCPWTWRKCSFAAQEGHLEVLQWARANGCPWDEKTCANAAYGGHLEVLQWARANGAPWDKITNNNAAHGGHLEVLQWARANGCLWAWGECLVNAKRNDHQHVLKWLSNNLPPFLDNLVTSLDIS